MPVEQGPDLLKPLIAALHDFFRVAGSNYDQIPSLDTRLIRRELFKLSYLSDKFGLNQKADAFEAYDFLLTAIHSWVMNTR
mmetsp:Transcript_17065/g.21568  ORF Transcript_17065/g.21568 Transcript_17065/m.21568 type:complete len:81 (-) Transcript_17065:92-334(-)